MYVNRKTAECSRLEDETSEKVNAKVAHWRDSTIASSRSAVATFDIATNHPENDDDNAVCMLNHSKHLRYKNSKWNIILLQK